MELGKVEDALTAAGERVGEGQVVQGLGGLEHQHHPQALRQGEELLAHPQRPKLQGGLPHRGGLAAGTLVAAPQTGDGATYARKIDKSECRVDWSLPAAAIERRLRAFTPAPGMQTLWGEVALKLGRSRIDSTESPCNKAPGEIVSVDPDGVVVACGGGTLRLLELQRPGGRMLPVADFIRGAALAPGQLLQ